MWAVLDWLAGRQIDWRLDCATGGDPELRQFNLKKIEHGRDGWEILAFAPAVAILAEQAAVLLEAKNAKNYVQFDMMPRLDRGLRPVRVTVQWANGESPAAKAARLENELALARGRSR